MKKLSLAALIGLAITASAQETEKVLDPVTISSSLIAQPVSQSGRNIVTINGDAFSKLPVNSIDELLRYLPGVEVQMRGPMGSQSDIVIRGGTFQQVLVILDGVRLNDPNTGHFNSYIPIAPSEIERIEILKGASSAIYGSEAVGGVITIVTKSFAAKKDAPEKLKLSGEAMLGEYNLANANIGALWQNKRTTISGGFLTNNTKGQLQRGIRGYAYNNTASVSINHYINDNWQIGFRSSYDRRDFAAQNFYTTFASDTATEKVTTLWNQLRLAYSKNKHHVSIDAGWKKVKDNFLYNSVSIENENKSALLQTTISDQWSISNSTTLLSGVQLINKSIRSNDRGNHELLQTAAFLILNQKIGAFTFNPAIRLDWNQRRGIEFVPQANLSWKHNKIQIRGSAGKTIRDADFTERYNNYNKPIVTGGSIGDPALEAERSFSWETGIDYFISKGLKLSGTFFQRHQKRIIDYVATPYANMPRKDNLVPGNTYALARNIASVTTSGGELDMQSQWQLSKQEVVQAQAGILWMYSGGSNVAPSFYISSHARFLTNFSLNYINRRISLSVNGIYKKRTPAVANPIHAAITRDYFLANAKASVRIAKGLETFAQVNNITNKKYSDLLGSIMPGRWFLIGIKFNLDQ